MLVDNFDVHDHQPSASRCTIHVVRQLDIEDYQPELGSDGEGLANAIFSRADSAGNLVGISRQLTSLPGVVNCRIVDFSVILDIRPRVQDRRDEVTALVKLRLSEALNQVQASDRFALAN